MFFKKWNFLNYINTNTNRARNYPFEYWKGKAFSSVQLHIILTEIQIYSQKYEYFKNMTIKPLQSIWPYFQPNRQAT